MKKRKVTKEKDLGIKKELSILAVLTLFLIIFFLIKPDYTGYVIYQPSNYSWSLDNPSDYVYDSNLINISNGEASLIPIITIEAWTTTNEIGYNVQQALSNGEDKTNKINSLDDEDQKIKQDKIFDVIFDGDLANEDIINIYINGGDSSDVYLCDASLSCSSPGYGLVHFNEDQEGMYSITIANLPSQSNSFSINVQNEIEVDYISATHFEIINHESTNITYPNSASLETNDVGLTTSQIVFSSEYMGEITYEYSIDSGNSWISIPENNISFDNQSNIRFKANLISDGLSTPVLNSFGIDYNSEICEESWTCTEWNECSQNTKTMARICTDANICGTSTIKPAETTDCFPDYYDIDNIDILSIEANKLTKINKTDVVIDLLTTENITGSRLTVELYEEHNSTKPKPSLKFVDIEGNQSLIESLNSTSVKIYYTDEEIKNLNLYEDSLKIYYYNENLSSWEALESTVNTEENYVEVNLTHFSTYGLFGENIEQDNPSQTSSSSSGSSSKGKKESLISKEVEQQEQGNVIEQDVKEQEESTIFEAEKNAQIEETSEQLSEITGQATREINNQDMRLVVAAIIILAIASVFMLKELYPFSKLKK